MNTNKLLVLLIVSIALTFSISGTPHAQSDAIVEYQETLRMGRGFLDRLSARDSGRTSWHPTEDILVVGGARGAWFFTSNLEDIMLLESGNGNISWSPDGRLLASWSLGLRVWNSETNEVTVLDNENSIKVATWSPDSRLLASSDYDNTIEIWDVLQNMTVSPLAGVADENIPFTITSLDWHPNGELLAGSNWYGTVIIWDVATGQILASMDEHEGHPNVVAWHPSGEFLASISDDGVLILWSVNDGEIEIIATSDDFAYTTTSPRIKWSPEGEFLAVTVDNTIQFATTSDLLARVNNFIIHEMPYAIIEMDWKPDEDLLATIDAGGYLSVLDFDRYSQQVNIIDIISGGHMSQVTSISLSPSGEMVASGSLDGTVRVWDVILGESISILDSPLGSVTSVSWNSSNQYVASASPWLSGNGSISVWDIGNWESVAISEIAVGALESIAWSPVTDVIASGGWDRTLRLWDFTTGEFLLEVEILRESINSVAWSPDGTRLAYGGYAGVLAIRDLSSTYETITYHSLYNLDFIIEITTRSLAWSPDGNILASGDGSGTIYLWETTTFEEISTIDAHNGPVSSLDFDVTGARLVSTSPFDDYAYIWDVDTGETIARIPNAVRINDVLWIADTNAIISGNLDGTISIWEPVSTTS